MKSSFGKYAILDPVRHQFKEEPDLWWDIKAATSGDELNVSRFMVVNRVVTSPDGARREMPPSWIEVAHREIALTFAGTNLPKDPEKPVEAGGTPLLEVGKSTVEQIEAVLRSMPHPMAMELWEAVGECNPLWGPPKPPPASSTPSTAP